MVEEDEKLPMNLDELNNEELLEIYGKVEEHLKYLNSSILEVPVEEENE